MVKLRRARVSPADVILLSGVLGAIAVLLAIWGWSLHPRGLGLLPKSPLVERIDKTLYAALAVIRQDSVYLDDNKTGGDVRLALARWLAAIALLTGGLSAGAALLGRDLLVWRAGRRVQSIIIGDHPISEALCDAAADKGRVVRFSRRVLEPTAGRMRVDLPLSAESAPAIARHARTIVVADADEDRALARAAQLSSMDMTVRLLISDPLNAQRFRRTGAGRIEPFSEASMAARQIVEDYPPVLLARFANAETVHVLIAGLDSLGAALIEEIALNGFLATAPAPVVTIIDPQASSQLAHLRLHRPGIDAVCELRAVDGPCGTALDLSGAPPVCVAYVCLGQAERAISAGSALNDEARRSGSFEAPIFVRLREAALLLDPKAMVALEPLQQYRFGGFERLAVRADLFGDMEAAARSAHQAYLDAGQTLWGPAKPESPAARTWDDLDETFRTSSRRTAAHVGLKLIEAGFDIEPWLADPRRNWLPVLSEPFYRDETERSRLAQFEHRRWMTERLLDGWRTGPRDDHRKTHPDLVSFDALSPQSQAFDFAIIDWLAVAVPEGGTGLRR